MQSSTTDNAIEAIVTTVLLLLLPRFAAAIFNSEAPFFDFRTVLFTPLPSVYLIASIGDTFEAVLAGFMQEINTVTSEKTAAAAKITGLAETVFPTPFSCLSTIGVST